MSTLILTKDSQEYFEDKDTQKLLKKEFGSKDKFYEKIIQTLNKFDTTLNLKDVSFADLQDADKYIGVVLDTELNKKYNICLIPPDLGTRSGFLTQQIFGFVSNIILSEKCNEKYLADKPIIIINCLVKDKLADSEICNIIGAKILGFHYIDMFNRPSDFNKKIESLSEYCETIKQIKDISKDFDLQTDKIIFKTDRLKGLKERLTNEPYYFAINAYPALVLASREGKEIDISAFDKKLLNTNKNKNIEAFVHFAETLKAKKFTFPKTELRYNKFINALRTKPFLLLAGISGTGKSRLVKELAYMTCPQNDELRKNPAEPGNYCLIEVKPNWHDSAELLGYYSNLSGRYELTKFIRFAYKAIKHPDTPFFVCLDEMNLAPVEQYFAEYLSVLETRKLEGDKIISSALLSRDAFANCLLEKTTQTLPASMPAYEPLQEGTNQKNTKLYSDDDAEIIQYLKQKGLTLPENLFIIGTVNMDDTTHQFSRKVIDRAFTIEMNGGNLSEMFDNKNSLDYRNDVVPLDAFKPKYVIANEALDEQSDENQTTIKEKIPELLESINNILKETPFCVSYRVQNELILYLCNILDDSDKIDEKISEAFLTILLTKILPRIQGDDKLLKTKSESGNDSNVLTDLQEFVKKKFTVVDGDNSELFNSVINKLEKMNSRLENSYFANFFG